MQNFDIQMAKLQDLYDICKLENEYGLEVYSENEIKSNLINDFYKIIVVRYKNQIIGYLSATIIFQECNIIKIIVSEKHKRKGVGSKLIDALKIMCQKLKVNHIYLEVRKDNLSAINFYEKQGFSLEGVRKQYYDDIDASIYGLKLL